MVYMPPWVVYPGGMVGICLPGWYTRVYASLYTLVGIPPCTPLGTPWPAGVALLCHRPAACRPVSAQRALGSNPGKGLGRSTSSLFGAKKCVFSYACRAQNTRALCARLDERLDSARV